MMRTLTRSLLCWLLLLPLSAGANPKSQPDTTVYDAAIEALASQSHRDDYHMLQISLPPQQRCKQLQSLLQQYKTTTNNAAKFVYAFHAYHLHKRTRPASCKLDTTILQKSEKTVQIAYKQLQKFQQKLKPNHLEFLAATYTRAAVRSNKHLGFPLTPSHQCTASAFQTFLRTFGTTRTLQQALIIAVSNELYEAEHMLDYVQRTLLLLQHHHQFPPAENHYLHELTRLLSHLLQHRLQRDERHRKTTLQAYEVRLTMAGIPRAQVKNYAQAISRMSLSCLSRLSPSFLRQYKHNLTLERGKRIFRVLESMAKNQAPIQKIPELPRLKNNLLYTGNRDAWNHPYLLHRTPTHVHLKSLGPDGKASQDDITIGSIQLSAPTILTPKKPSTSRPSSHPTSRPKAR